MYNSHKNHPVAHYYYLFSSYKLALFKLKDKRTVNAWCKEVVKETKNAEHPQDDKMASEFLALQATAYDALCMHSMFKSMYYAKKAKDVFAQSLEKDET
ncbi:MAG: hypothetical protein GWN00_27480, partial [Aliifodinibius sp.]|nr:hypothetical protein [Fodinibius sp.]NIY28409.1 hypothetical protein [Fodinibius sp.]